MDKIRLLPPPAGTIGHNSARGVFTHAVNDNKIVLKPAGISRVRRMNGSKPNEGYRFVSWTDPVDRDAHFVGFLFERWPPGTLTRMNAVPYNELHVFEQLGTREQADARRESVALSHVFTDIHDVLLARCTRYERLPDQYLPFAKPDHWHPEPDRVLDYASLTVV